MNILVTGGAGNLGSVVVDDLLRSGHYPHVFDSRPPSREEVPFSIGDIRDEAAVRKAIDDSIDAVVHLAAIPAYRKEIPAVDYIHVNVGGTQNVVEAAARREGRRVVLASSDSALGMVFATQPFAPQYLPIDEAHPLAPQDPYGLSKALGEEVCAAATRRYGLQTICLRFCWVWFDNTHGERSDILAGDPGILARTLWGYVDVRDAAQACRLACEREIPEGHAAFFVTAEDSYAETSSLDLIHTHYPGVGKVDEAYFSSPYRSLFDIRRARERLGYDPAFRYHS
jgi:nucleoside-diphosphate-sugar epimerase